MKKGYVVLEIGYEYNDEIMHTSYNGATYNAPTNVYTVGSVAIEAAAQKTYKELRGLSLGHYCYGVDEVSNSPDELLEFLKTEFKLDKDEDYELTIPSDATDEQLDKLMNIINLEFFTVKEIEIE